MSSHMLRLRCSTHLFAAGFAPVGLDYIQPLITNTGGKALLYDQYDTGLCASDVLWIAGLSSCLKALRLEVTCSKELHITRVLGPAMTPESKTQEGGLKERKNN